jgi:HlyD family secretion protein
MNLATKDAASPILAEAMADQAGAGATIEDEPLPIRRKPRRAVWIGAALVLAALAAAAIYNVWGGRGVLPSYRLGAVTRGPVTAAVVASGTVNPVITVQVGSQVSGQIKELHADFNSEVKTGQLIARIDPDLFQTRVAQGEADLAIARAAVSTQRAGLRRARADLETAKSNLTAVRSQTIKARVALADARRDYDRKQRLLESGAAPVADRDKAQAAYEEAEAQLHSTEAQELSQAAAIRSAEAQLDAAQAGIEAAEAQALQKQQALGEARVNLEHTYIRAPVDGMVILRNVDVGQTVAASLQAPVLFTIAQDLRDMRVHTSVDEADVGAVKLGQRVIFTVDAFANRSFEGNVVQIRKAPQVVQNVVTYDIVTSAPNPELLLLPGLTANVRIVIDHRVDALLVPNAALRYRPSPVAKAAPSALPAAGPNEGWVYVLGADGSPRAVRAKLGITDGNSTEVIDGTLRPGQQVVLGEIAAGAGPQTAQPGLGFGPRL